MTTVQLNGQPIEGTVVGNALDGWDVTLVSGETLSLTLQTLPNGQKVAEFNDGTRLPVAWASAPTQHALCIAGHQWLVERPQVKKRGGAVVGGATGGNAVVATMPGNVLQVLVQPGDAVTAGQTVVVMESMKMEMNLAAPMAGVVQAVKTQAGDKVEQGAVLIQLEAETAEASDA